MNPLIARMTKRGLRRPRAAISKTPAAVAASASGASRDVVGEWGALVQRHLAAGATNRAAIANAVKENPTLHREYLNAVNARKGSTGSSATNDAKPHVSPAPNVPVGAKAIAAFNAAVDAKVAAGVDRARAVSEIAQRHPDLMTAYNDAECDRRLQVRRNRLMAGMA